MTNDNDHQDIQERHKQTMRELGQLLDIALNPDGQQQVCFTLLITEFGEDDSSRMNYISNGTREDMIAALKEFIANAEAHADAPDLDKLN